jgi:hypothetical protein
MRLFIYYTITLDKYVKKYILSHTTLLTTHSVRGIAFWLNRSTIRTATIVHHTRCTAEILQCQPRRGNLRVICYFVCNNGKKSV